MTLEGGGLGVSTLESQRPSAGAGLLPVGLRTTNLQIPTGLRAQESASLTVTPGDSHGLQRLRTLGDGRKPSRP